MSNFYEDYCVAFIDILGFKEMTKNLENIKVSAETLTKTLNKMKDSSNTRFFTNLETNIATLQGADSLFLLFPKDFYNCYDAIIKIMKLQFELAINGIYVRGSINTGAMFIDTANDIYFGEAWNKAVTAEKEAINPRIIIENDIANLIESQLREKYNESVGEFYIDDDGSYVLSSYGIGPAFDFKNHTYSDGERLQHMLLNKLEQMAHIYHTDRSVLKKYLWIANAVKRDGSKDVKEKSESAKLIITRYLTDTF